MIAIPSLTILTALAGAKLLLSETVADTGTDLIACIGIGAVAMLVSMFGAYRASRKKFVWGMLFSGAYLGILMLSNLLFFGEGYGKVLPNLIAVAVGGIIGSMLGAGKRKGKRSG